MLHRDGSVPGASGMALYYQSWHPATPAKAVLLIVHGLGSYSGQFENVVNAVVPRGYAVYGFDLRGHGRSPGQRGYINHWAEFREDLAAICHLIQAEHPTVPCFGLGHSLGAVILLDYALQHPTPPLAGLIVMSPALGPVGISPVRLAIGQIVSRVWPRFTLNTGIPMEAGSRDAAVVTAYSRDPLRHTKGTARLVTEFLKTSQWVQTHLVDLQTPILMLHGSDDQVTSSDSSQAFFAQLRLTDKQYCEYAGGYHDLHNDWAVEQMMVDLLTWLDRHVDIPQVNSQEAQAEAESISTV